MMKTNTIRIATVVKNKIIATLFLGRIFFIFVWGGVVVIIWPRI